MPEGSMMVAGTGVDASKYEGGRALMRENDGRKRSKRRKRRHERVRDDLLALMGEHLSAKKGLPVRKAARQPKFEETKHPQPKGHPIQEGVLKVVLKVPKSMNLLDIIHKARGGGRMGRQALGPGGDCVCPECGYSTPHNRAEPCDEKRCPKCGAAMTRKVEAAKSLHLIDIIQKGPRKGRARKRKPPLGTGERFKQLEAELSDRDKVTDPAALAAWIGRKKHGKTRMAEMSARGRKRRRRKSLLDYS